MTMRRNGKARHTKAKRNVLVMGQGASKRKPQHRRQQNTGHKRSLRVKDRKELRPERRRTMKRREEAGRSEGQGR